jgi:hypothetical protein
VQFATWAFLARVGSAPQTVVDAPWTHRNTQLVYSTSKSRSWCTSPTTPRPSWSGLFTPSRYGPYSERDRRLLDEIENNFTVGLGEGTQR